MSQNEAKKNGLRISGIIIGIALCQTSFALAPIPLAALCMISDSSRSMSSSKELDLKLIEDLTRRMQAEADQSKARWTLHQISASDSQGAVTQKILQASAQNLIEDQPSLKSLGSTLNTLQAPLESNFEIESEDGDDSFIKVSVDAAQAKAQLEYYGAINASLEIHTPTASATLKMHRQITENFQLALTSHTDSNHSSQTLGLSMNW